MQLDGGARAGLAGLQSPWFASTCASSRRTPAHDRDHRRRQSDDAARRPRQGSARSKHRVVRSKRRDARVKRRSLPVQRRCASGPHDRARSRPPSPYPSRPAVRGPSPSATADRGSARRMRRACHDRPPHTGSAPRCARRDDAPDASTDPSVRSEEMPARDEPASECGFVGRRDHPSPGVVSLAPARPDTSLPGPPPCRRPRRTATTRRRADENALPRSRSPRDPSGSVAPNRFGRPSSHPSSLPQHAQMSKVAVCPSAPRMASSWRRPQTRPCIRRRCSRCSSRFPALPHRSPPPLMRQRSDSVSLGSAVLPLSSSKKATDPSPPSRIAQQGVASRARVPGLTKTTSASPSRPKSAAR